MRKKQLSVVKEMSDIFKQAHESLLKLISEKTINEEYLNIANTLLTQCQTNAINMGNLIEESEGEGFVTVKYLEDYCELVYSINEDLQINSGTDNPGKIYKKLNKMLQKIENSINHDIPLKREAVFLPYKASMWDSLESVWIAANKDPNCDAYVIPIPYFDKNSDGSLREEHYEGDLFPNDVPITHYSDFDFGKHHPDMIFIHNPYDYGNLVTTIHPFFYAENMKKVTDCLVYIPYFATSGAMGAEKSWCPVYEYADYIVIQSESYRQYYSKDIPDEKFLAFGSPKFDKVIIKCQNPPTPPEEWVKRAGGRKVMFYNTSLNCMLQNTPQYLRKMQYVFETFKNNSEYCLLWRPHPLFESTLKAMRPNYLEVYRALRDTFIEEDGWILDETPCVEDTIAFCDGYIGDSASSIVALFGVAGKRIFLLDDAITNISYREPYSRQIKPINSSFENNGDYIITEENVVYKRAFKYKYEKYVELDEDILPASYSAVYKYNNLLIVAPCVSQKVALIDSEKRVSYIYLNHRKEGWQFIESYFCNGRLILIPHDYPALVIVDFVNNEIQYISEISDFIKTSDGVSTHYGSSSLLDNKLYVTDGLGNKCLILNLDDYSKEIIELNLNIGIKKCIVHKSETIKCLIIHESGPFVTLVDLASKEHITINLFVDGLKLIKDIGEDKYYFDNAIIAEDYIYFSPQYANKIIRIDRNNNVEECKIETNGEINENNRRYGYFIGGEPIFYNYKEGFCVEISGNSQKRYSIQFDEKDVTEDLRRFGQYGSACQYCNVEKGLNLLGDYLKYYNKYNYSMERQIESYKNVNASCDGRCGEKVYEHILENKI